MDTLSDDPLALGYRLRRATVRDIRAVHRLEQVIFPRDAYPYFDLALLFLWPREINLKIVAPDGSLAGFVSGVPGWHSERGWIVTLGVAPGHRRRGLARLLLECCECRLKRPTIRLTVRESNAPAITLYRSVGYTVIERRIGYYRDGEAGLVMQKRVYRAARPALTQDQGTR